MRDFWRDYKVLIVMLPSLGLLHWGWYSLKGNPLLRPAPELDAPEPPAARPAPARPASAGPASAGTAGS